MSEYFFIRGYDDFKRPGIIPESFVEKAFGFYERRGAPFFRRSKKPGMRFFTTVKFCIWGNP